MKVKILNIFVVFAIIISFLPLNAFAIEKKNKTYTYDNYTVDYNITDSWDDTQNITVYVTNTGYEPIENWMLAYDFKGEVYDIWNAEVKQNADGVKYIRNLGYNNIIEPGSTMNFGYTLNNANGFPDDITMCQKRVTKETGFDVKLDVLDSWDDNFKGEITIQNNTDTVIECWELSFDSNFTIIEITDSWAANISNYNDGTYTLKGTYTNVIYANSSVTLGFMGIKSGEPEIFDYSLTEVAADEISIPEEKEPDNSDDIIHVDDMYYKPILSSDDVDYDGKGIYFVRNQVLVTAYQDVSFDEVKELAEKYNAEIVGYIWLTNDYQLEFKNYIPVV